MKSVNNELTIVRNESFTFDKKIVNRDDSPYIISSELKNPYFLVSVASAVYAGTERYICNFWLPVELPRFYCTTPVDIGTFTDENGNPLYRDFQSMSGLPSGYVNGLHVTYEVGDALFYCINEQGEKVYKYHDGTQWRDYECRIVFKVPSWITSEWTERSYLYNIDLVDGVKSEAADAADKPIASVSELIPILMPTKLSVLSNLKGGM